MEGMHVRGMFASELSNLVGRSLRKMEDHWKSFAMELWGLSVMTWDPIPERAGMLPEPLEYDTVHDGLVELEARERCLVIQTISGYQV
jgi:hypothetical protein